MNAPGRAVEVIEIVDSARYVGLPLGVAVLTVCIMLVDGYDLQAMSFAAPAIVADWGVARADLGWVLTASMIGMAVGSVALGRLSDRIGRKAAILSSLLSVCVGSLLVTHAHSLHELVAWRALTGIGLGGLTPLATTFVAEWTPRRARTIAVACVLVSVPLGGMLGAIAAQHVIPAFGWVAIFWIGAALPLLLCLLAAALLPESPRYLAQDPAKSARLALTLNRLVGEPRFAGTERFHVAEPITQARNWLGIILSREYRRTTLLLWAAFAINTTGLYSYVNWLPTVLTSAGFTQTEALNDLKYFNFGGFFGAIGGAILIGRYGSRLVGTGIALLGVLATALVGVTLTASTAPGLQLSVLILMAGLAFNGMQSFVYAIGAHSYPTYVRGAGVGSAQTISRIGGVLGGLAAGAFFGLRPQPPVSNFFYAVAILDIALVLAYFALRTHIPPNHQHLKGTQP
jgi:AAHS family 4-hydroxybenzoate transporter-like MFS transporter